MYSSVEVVRIISITQRVFQQFVFGRDSHDFKINSDRRSHLKLLTKTVYEATISDIFTKVFAHDMQYACNLDDDLHSTQLVKTVAAKFLSVRIARYGQE